MHTRLLRRLKESGPRSAASRTPCRLAAPILLLATALVYGGAAFAAHPLITDDAGTTGAGSRQLEINGEYVHDEERSAGVFTEEDGAELAAAFTYGLTESVDVVFGLPHQWMRVREDGSKTGDAHGAADCSLELKWRLYDARGLSLALKPGLSLPTGDEDKGLGNGRVGYGLTVIGTREADPFAFHLNLGYTANENTAGDRRDLWHASLAGEVPVAEGLKAVANLGVETNPDPAADSHPAFALAGIIWSVSDRLSLDCGVKGGLNDAETDITGLAGITLSF